MPSPSQGYNVFFDILQEIQDEGLALPFQTTLNFIGTGVTATDDPGNNRTNVNIPGNVQPHDLLDGSQNQDTVAHPVVAGDLIFGTGSPLWDGLAIGTPSQVLTVVGGFPAWATLPADIDFYQTIQDEGVALPQQPTFNFIGAGVTAVDNPGANSTDITIPGGGGAGVWEDLADVSPVSDTDVITATFSPRQFLRVYAYLHTNGAGSIDTVMIINGDSSTEYATRRSQNGASDVTGTNQSGIELDVGGVGEHELIIIDIEDRVDHTKMGFSKTVQTDSADEFTAPERQLNYFTYSINTARITSLTFTNNNPGSYTNVSRIRVLGFN